MLPKRWDELSAVLGQLTRRLEQLEHTSVRMETILMVKEPTSTAAAEAYEGLRKQVVTAVSERNAHLVQLVQLDSALRYGADSEALRKLADGWLEQASLQRVADPDHPHFDLLFELVENEGGEVEVVDPAYVDSATGRVVRQGRARRTAPASGAHRVDQVEAAVPSGGQHE